MSELIDARGLSCPTPVLMAKKALAQEGAQGLQVLVDNEAAAENLRALGASLGYEVQVAADGSGGYTVSFAPGGQGTAPAPARPAREQYIVVLAGDEMGQGDPAFGRKLLEGYLYALTEQDELPAYILCYNKGVYLTCVNEKSKTDLAKMEAKGVQVLSCGLCLDYYGLKEQLGVGQVTNMYRICELMRSYPVVRP
ncbi:MAG: sulfurtransferase-like selenium metabolism protein YedF [Clostridiales bacterium]|nr:sulfurtransferase-like selenium metabolism protein YedF [Clostridiales bacterium]